MTNIDPSELEQAKAESEATMRTIGRRCRFAGEMANVLEYLMDHRPGDLPPGTTDQNIIKRCARERTAQGVLVEELQNYLANTTTMVNQIRIQRLEIDIAESTVKIAEQKAAKQKVKAAEAAE